VRCRMVVKCSSMWCVRVLREGCPANFVEDQCSEGGVPVTIVRDPLVTLRQESKISYYTNDGLPPNRYVFHI